MSADNTQAADSTTLDARAGSAMDLLREILDKDRAAIRELKSTAPWYQPPDELLDLHRRMEACLSPNAPTSATKGGQP